MSLVALASCILYDRACFYCSSSLHYSKVLLFALPYCMIWQSLFLSRSALSEYITPFIRYRSVRAHQSSACTHSGAALLLRSTITHDRGIAPHKAVNTSHAFQTHIRSKDCQKSITPILTRIKHQPKKCERRGPLDTTFPSPPLLNVPSLLSARRASPLPPSLDVPSPRRRALISFSAPRRAFSSSSAVRGAFS